MLQSALLSAERAEEIGLPRSKIILSAKVSAVQDLIGVYAELARRSNYALHLGLTEAGMGSKGIVASSAAMAYCCSKHRRHDPYLAHPRTERRPHARSQSRPGLLQTVGCARSYHWLLLALLRPHHSTTFQELASSIQKFIRDSMRNGRHATPALRASTSRSWVASSTGPGESKHADMAFRCRAPARADGAGFIDGKRP